MRKLNKNKILVLALSFIMIFSNLVGAASAISGRNIIKVKVEKKDPVTLMVESGNRIVAIDEQIPDDSGYVKFRVNLPNEISLDDVKIKTTDGRIDSSKIEVEKIKDDEEKPVDPDPEPKEKTVSLNIDGYKGTILSKRNIEVKAGESVLDVTLRLLDANGIKYQVKNGYVVSIDGQAEFDKGSGSGWMYSVDGQYPNKGADYLRAKDYKRIDWKYTYDLGKDIGAGSSWKKIDDKSDNKIDEILKLLDEKDIKEKDLSKQLSDLFKEIGNIPSSKRISYGERIYNTLYKLEPKFTSDDIALKIGKIIVKTTEEVNKDSDKNQDKINLFSKNLGLVNSSLKNIRSEKERTELAKDMVKSLKDLNMKTNNSNKISKALIKIDFDGKEKIKLNKELLGAIKNQEIEKLILSNKNVSLEVRLENLIGDVNIILSKDEISIKDGDKIMNLTPPIKIKVKSSNENSLMKLNGEIIGGLNKGKETVAYGNRLGKIELKDRKKVNFEDLGNYSWAKEAVEILGGNEVVAGRNESKFDPKANITRAEFSALVARLLNLEPGSKDLNFKDVDSKVWYSPSVKALSEKGYINGRTSEKFDPNGKITREEMSKILGEILKDYDYKQVAIDELNKFTDNSQVSSWAKEGAAIVVKNEALKGSDGKFNPKANATRAETVTMLYRTYKLILED